MALALEAECTEERQTSPSHEERLLRDDDPEAMTSPGPSAAPSAFARKATLAGSILLGLMGCAGLALGTHAASLKNTGSIVAEHMIQEYDDKHLCHSCPGGTCDCGWATPDKCASGQQNPDCCFDCCCSAHNMDSFYGGGDAYDPIYGHGDSYHGSRTQSVDTFHGHGDAYHGSGVQTCKYSVGSQVFVHGQDGGWHHATVRELHPGCHYTVRLTEGIVRSYHSGHPWWSLMGSWWLILLIVLAIVAVVAILLSRSKK